MAHVSRLPDSKRRSTAPARVDSHWLQRLRCAFRSTRIIAALSMTFVLLAFRNRALDFFFAHWSSLSSCLSCIFRPRTFALTRPIGVTRHSSPANYDKRLDLAVSRCTRLSSRQELSSRNVHGQTVEDSGR